MSYDIVFRGVDKVSGVSKSIAKNVKDDQDKIKSSTGRTTEGFNKQRHAASGLTKEIGILRNKFLVYGFAVAGTLGILNKLVGESEKLTESVNAVNVVFGSGANSILEYGKTASVAVGLANSEFNQLSVVTGALFRNTSLSASEVSAQTITLAERASDLASVFNTDVKDAMSAINQAIRGETEAIRRYAGDVTDATLQEYLFSEGIDVSVRSLSEQAKRLLRVEVLLKQTEVAQGDFANTIGSSANSARVLNSQFKDFLANLGSFLEPAKAQSSKFLSRELASLSALLRGEVSESFRIANLSSDEFFEELKKRAGESKFDEVGPANVEGMRKFREEQTRIALEGEAYAEKVKQQNQYIITQEDMLVARGLEFNEVTNNTNEVLIEVAKQLGIAGINAEYLSTLWKVSGEVEVPNILEEMNNVTKSTIDWGAASESVASQLARAYSEGKKVSKELRLGFGIAATLLRLIPATGLLGGLLGSASSFLGSFQSGVDMSFNTGATSSQGRMYAFRAHDDESVRLQVGRPGSTVNNTTNDSSIGTIVINNYSSELNPRQVAVAVREAMNRKYLT